MMRHSAHQEIVLGTEHVEGRAAARGFSPDRHIARASALQDCAIRECAVRHRCSSAPTLHTCGLFEHSKAKQTAHKCSLDLFVHVHAGDTKDASCVLRLISFSITPSRLFSLDPECVYMCTHIMYKTLHMCTHIMYKTHDARARMQAIGRYTMVTRMGWHGLSTHPLV